MTRDPVYRCDGPIDHVFGEHENCIVHSRARTDLIAVTDFDGRRLHFCTWDCLLRFAATVEPDARMTL